MEVPSMPENLKDIILTLLSSPNIAAKEWIYRQYDHEVQVRSIVKPGGDAGVLRIIDDKQGLAVSCGCNPVHVEANPYTGGAGAVIENAMNLAAVGARPLALVDCLNFGNPERSEIFYQFKQACMGLGDAARILEIPVVGGNVSFYNESDEFGTAIAPTPSIGMVGWVQDLDHIPASTFQQADETIILIGETRAELGGSEYYSLLGLKNNGSIPAVPENIDTIVTKIILAVESGLVATAHDVSNGGLAVAVCEMTGTVGAEVDISGFNLREDACLFSESYGRMVVSTKRPEQVMEILSGIPCRIIGKTGGSALKIQGKNEIIALSSGEITRARANLTHLMMD